MRLLNYLKFNKPSSANIAKERLQIIISHERSKRNNTELLALMQQELLEVISKYLNIDRSTISEQVKVELERRGDSSVLELNITLPDRELAFAAD
jgi:cell division topological specificity factor